MHAASVGYDKGIGSNVNYAWLYRTLTGCLHAVAMAAVSMLVQACQQCIFFQYLDDEYDCRI